MFNNSFFKFFFAFVAIIAVAFGVLVLASAQQKGESVDTTEYPG